MLWIYFDINTTVPSSQHPSAHWAHLLYKPITLLSRLRFLIAFFLTLLLFLLFSRRRRERGGSPRTCTVRFWMWAVERISQSCAKGKRISRQRDHPGWALKSPWWAAVLRVFMRDSFISLFYHRVSYNDRTFVDPIYCSTLWIHSSVIISHANETQFYFGAWRMSSGAWWHSSGYFCFFGKTAAGWTNCGCLGCCILVTSPNYPHVHYRKTQMESFLCVCVLLCWTDASWRRERTDECSQSRQSECDREVSGWWWEP